MATPVQAYRTTDGKMFENFKAAEAHEHALRLEKEIVKFVKSRSRVLFDYSDHRAIIEWEEHKVREGIK
jgi:hypothetical protein